MPPSTRFARSGQARLVFALAAIVGLGAAGAQAQLALEPIDKTGLVTYFVADGVAGSAFRTSDKELATWALKEWERILGGALRFEPAAEHEALIRVQWVPPGGGQYGEMVAVPVNGRRGAVVMIRPDTDGLGPDIARMGRQDPLFRDTVVYLTCLHELGHALGLSHTAAYGDIMYAFGYGGDIPGFFLRYRNQLKSRADIVKAKGVSDADIKRLIALYPR